MEIGGYKVTAAANGFALAESKTAPNPFVVWTVDRDGNGVCVGHYFNEREEAEWDFCARAFDWFEDNVNIDCLVSWFYELHLLLKRDRKAQKIEPMQKRQLIATAQSLLRDLLDALDSEQSGSDN